MIIGIKASIALTKHLSCECKCRFHGGKNVIQIHGGITINVDVDAKKFVYVKKNMFGILVNVFVRMENI